MNVLSIDNQRLAFKTVEVCARALTAAIMAAAAITKILCIIYLFYILFHPSETATAEALARVSAADKVSYL